MLALVPCVCVRHLPRPAVLRRELVIPLRLWLTCRPLRRRAVSGALSGRRTYRSESVRSRACCARRGLSGAVFRRGFRLAGSVGGSLQALRPRAAIFPALCEWTKACRPASLVAPRRAPRDAFGTEEFPCGAACSLITLRRRTKNEKRLTMALQRTAPRVTVAAIPVRCRPVRSWLSFTSVAAFFVPPSQLPRHAPPSLSLSRSAMLRAS